MSRAMFRENGKRIAKTVCFVIFFLLFYPLAAYSAAPSVGTITPSSGTGQIDTPQTFTAIYSDPDGWLNLSAANFLVNTIVSGANCLSAYYDQNSNLIFMRNDAGTGWLGGYAPGSANIIENSYAKIDCSQTTVSGNGTTLTVSWKATFKASFTGTKNIYLGATDDQGSATGAVQKGTWTINNPPSVGTVTPSSGTGQVDVYQTFNTTYSDADGWQNLQSAKLLINATNLNGNYCFDVYYDQNANLLYLLNDQATTWLGGFAPGSAHVIENSYSRLDCSQTTVSGNGTTLTVNWRASFKSSFTGTKNIYMGAIDDTGYFSGYFQKGTWTIPNNSPALGTVTPSSGTGLVDAAKIFVATYSDADGWQNIAAVRFLVNTQATAVNCLGASYDRNANLLYLLDDAGTTWLGGFAPGSVNTIENSYARINCAQTSVSGSGNTLTVNWSVSFKSTFTGAKNTYLKTVDNAGVFTDIIQKGTWSIDSPPTLGTVTPSSGTGQVDVPQTFTATYSDADGWQDLWAVNFLVNTQVSGESCLSAYYDQNANQIFMRSDSGTAWLGGFAPGSAHVIENSYVQLDCSQTTISGNGTTLTVNWRVTFKPLFTGAKNIYLGATDDAGYFTGAAQKGTWTIQPDTTAPQVAITSPLDGAVFTDP